MPQANPLYDATIRHQVFLERLKANHVKDITPFLRKIDRNIRARLANAELTTLGRRRLNKLLAGIGEMITGEFSKYSKQLLLDLKDIGISESIFETRSLDKAIKGFESVIPAPAQVTAAMLATPLSVRGAHGGKLLTPFVRDWSKTQKETLVNVIRQGAFEGQTNAQIVRAVRGTAPAKFLDGKLAVVNRQTKALVRTAVQHVSSTARAVSFEENGIENYQWLSTLDSRTSDICQALSGRIFKVGGGPMPPVHINCRSTTIASLGPEWDWLKEGGTQSSQLGPVDAKETYFSWLKDQPLKFQEAAIGPNVAKLLNKGGLSAKRFAKLRLDKNFKPLTLAEMQKLEPLAFVRAGIKINPATGLPVSGR